MDIYSIESNSIINEYDIESNECHNKRVPVHKNIKGILMAKNTKLQLFKWMLLMDQCIYCVVFMRYR